MTATLVSLLAGACAIGLIGYVIITLKGGPDKDPAQDELWARAAEQQTSTAGKTMLEFARPFARVQTVGAVKESSVKNVINEKLLAAGGIWGSSAEVFITVQAAAILVSIIILLVTLAGVFPVILGLVVAVAIAVAPYQQIDSAAKKRSADITSSLPEFAELLQMPLAGGMTVLKSIEFTASRSSGVVADEMIHMITLINAKTLTEGEAFTFTGKRLGTPEAQSFCNNLRQASAEGTRVVDTLKKQSEALRNAQYQARRSESKKLPVKLIFVFAIHLMPLLFIIILLPVLMALSGI